MSSSDYSSSSSQSPTDILKNATFSRSEGPPVSPDSAVTASDLLMATYDPARLHPLAQIGDKLDYLLLDDEKTSELPGASTAIPSRGWSDDLCYGTGTTYLGGMSEISFTLLYSTTRSRFAPHLLHVRLTLSQYIRDTFPIFSFLIVFACHMLTLVFQGLALGGAWGLREGARRPLAVSNSRLRINSILNSVTRRGTFIGNSAGVLGQNVTMFSFPFVTSPTLALVYNAINSSIDAMRGKHDTLGSMAAGGLTGAIFKSTGTV
ncbi:hypothetical protein M378DRAFT_161871 [Amanita muscaria Koide BX008]|uniref:Uncharacterized protein n=1 Tax=Amanita muscaria (strain Koide BX008) TaxID=946122 RepID=A0A0C2X8D1_AMAMK|nr:hypothetical protein M378DRAFT_161871 [Amanita muscaria Koide BX008]